jgi:hypothetical protein
MSNPLVRWRFIDPKNEAENADRRRIVQKIDAWWRAFQNKSKDISALFSRKSEWDLPAWMNEHLNAIHPQIMWEYGPAVKGQGHRLVMTPESAHHLRPLVNAILERAPRIADWEFYPHRLAESVEDAIASVSARTGVDLSSFKVQAAKGAYNRVDLTFTSEVFHSAEDQNARNAAFVATESLLGEAILDEWIGAIEYALPPKASLVGNWFGKKPKDAGGNFHRLETLPEMVRALVGSTLEQLPPEPHYLWAENAQWSVGQGEPDEQEDYAGRGDLLTFTTLNMDLLRTALGAALFSSRRFSRCGETFCYLKIDGLKGLPDKGFNDRDEIEEALNETLIAQKLGCHIGGAMGLRYVYIDLALTDLDRGIAAIKERLRAGNVPNRTWIQFFDTDLAAEWVGIYDNTPPPPMDFEE